MKKKAKKNILLIGVGGTGSDAVDMIYQKIDSLKNQNGNHISAIVFDTDVGSIEKIKSAKAVPLADNASVGTICDRVGKKYIKDWFPCDEPAIRTQEMIRGASQWRKKSYLAFLNLMNKPKLRSTFTSVLEEMAKDPNASCEVYVISSLAGGTGSGSFIPIALYTKRYLRKTLGKNPIVNAVICLPDIFADSQTPENKIKIYANAYAILRELNAINLVARNYNDGHSLKKKSPIKMKIGHKDEPNVGMLFDSEDPAYWTPEAAPFSQIFVLDKIPCVSSVKAHNLVLGDSLYSMICTDIGAQFDSEFSNHEIVRSQANGSNAIYASVSTSQMRFPKDTILDYLAHKKTLSACDDEWLYLYNRTNDQINYEKKEAAELNRKFTLDKGGYSKLYLQQLELENENNNGRINALVDRGTAIFDAETGRKDPTKSTCDSYFETLKNVIKDKIVKPAAIEGSINKLFEEIMPQEKKGFHKAQITSENVVDTARKIKRKLVSYYQECLELINRGKASIPDMVMTFDKKKNLLGNKDLSLVGNVLMSNKKYIHPVAAMTQLCRLREILAREMPAKGWEPWTDLRKQDVSSLPADFTKLEASSVKKSGYGRLGDNRFSAITKVSDGSDYGKKTNTEADLEQLKIDFPLIASSIYDKSVKQLTSLVLNKICGSVDLLIDKYQSFFNRFEKEKAEFEEETRVIKEKDSSIIDSIVNVYSSPEDKDHILEQIESNSDFSDEQLAEVDDVSGQGVFNTVYASAVAASNNVEWNDKDSSAYRSLFKGMVDSYKNFLLKNEAYQAVASYNVVEAIQEMCGEDEKARNEVLKSYFGTALERATPSLKVDMSSEGKDLVSPSVVMVFMISVGTAKYITKNADQLNLNVTVGSDGKESSLIYACAEQFIKKYSGSESARVCVVNTLNDDSTIYCTGETMDISPLRIAKFDELGEDNTYFKYYSEAIRRWKKYDTDMWNPHLGNNFHKRGYLPYMNEAMEEICDVKMAKAILYSLWSKEVAYIRGSGQMYQNVSFKCNNEENNRVSIKDEDGNFINENNIAKLFSWYRSLEDDKIELWAEAYDKEIKDEMNSLPNIASDSEIKDLETKITNLKFMEMLNEKLFDLSGNYGYSENPNNKEERPISIIEFAYLIKTSEETIHDNDDAERILRVAYASFKDIVSCKANPDSNTDRFVQVYRQQLRNVIAGLVNMDAVKAGGAKNIELYLKNILSWLYFADTFRDISLTKTIDSTGKVRIDEMFNLDDKEDSSNNAGVRKAIADVRQQLRDKGKDDPEAAKSDEVSEVVTEAVEGEKVKKKPGPKGPHKKAE